MNESEAKYWASQFSDEELDALADAADPQWKKLQAPPGPGLDPNWEEWYHSKTHPADFKEWHANHPQIQSKIEKPKQPIKQNSAPLYVAPGQAVIAESFEEFARTHSFLIKNRFLLLAGLVMAFIALVTFFYQFTS